MLKLHLKIDSNLQERGDLELSSAELSKLHTHNEVIAQYISHTVIHKNKQPARWAGCYNYFDEENIYSRVPYY